MAKHGAAATLLVASLLVAVALAAGADARKPLHGKLILRRDVRKPLHTRFTLSGDVSRKPLHTRFTLSGDASRAYVAKEDAAAAVPALTCSKVHGVQEGETCFSVEQAGGLTQDAFLGFNPNINCQTIFIGQWVCLAATSA